MYDNVFLLLVYVLFVIVQLLKKDVSFVSACAFGG